MGLYFIEYGAAPRPVQVLYDRRDSAFARLTAEDVDWEPVRRARLVHLTGITPALGSGPRSACRAGACARHPSFPSTSTIAPRCGRRRRPARSPNRSSRGPATSSSARRRRGSSSSLAGSRRGDAAGAGAARPQGDDRAAPGSGGLDGAGWRAPLAAEPALHRADGRSGRRRRCLRGRLPVGGAERARLTGGGRRWGRGGRAQVLDLGRHRARSTCATSPTRSPEDRTSVVDSAARVAVIVRQHGGSTASSTASTTPSVRPSPTTPARSSSSPAPAPARPPSSPAASPG